MACHLSNVLISSGFGLLGGLALAAFIALLGYRRPWKIAGFHNLRMIKAGLAMGWVGFWSVFLATIPGDCVPLPNTPIGNLLIAIWIVLPAVFGAVWAIYWGIPFFRKKTGNKAVDATIARYRRSGEIVRAGLPTIRDKDGARYFWIVYGCCGKVTVSIAIRAADGQPVTEAAKMRYLSRCARMAYAMAFFGDLYKRMQAYRDGKKALRAWPRAMRVFDRATAMYSAQEGTPLWEDIQALRRGWEIFKAHGEAMLKVWEEEGAWADAHGWEHTREIPCEAMEALEAKLQFGSVLIAHAEEVRRAAEAAHHLLALLPQFEKKARQWQVRQVQQYITLVLEMEQTLQVVETHREGNHFYRFQPWTEEEEQQWQRRLRLATARTRGEGTQQ